MKIDPKTLLSDPTEERHLFNDCGKFRIGADVIEYLIPERHPMIMVDRVIDYRRSPRLQLSAERYVSANDPVFVGHFPGLKLWPGVHTIEGLRQCCALLYVICQLEEVGILDGLLELQRKQMLQPQVNEDLCQRAIDTIQRIRLLEQSPLKVRVKLIAPVFRGMYH